MPEAIAKLSDPALVDQVCNGVVAAGAGRPTSWDDVAGQQVCAPLNVGLRCLTTATSIGITNCTNGLPPVPGAAYPGLTSPASKRFARTFL